MHRLPFEVFTEIIIITNFTINDSYLLIIGQFFEIREWLTTSKGSR